MESFIYLIIITSIILTFVRPIYGLSMFIAVRILVPEIARTPGIDLSLNSAIIGIVALITFVKKLAFSIKVTIRDKLSKVLLLFIVYNALVLPLSDYGSLSDQYGLLLQSFLTDFLPIILCIIIIRDESDVIIVKRVFLFATIICCMYGIMSYVTRANPYVLSFAIFYQWRDTGDYANEVLSLGERGFSTSGTFIHSNGFGYFITMSIPIVSYFIYCNRKDNLSKLTLALLIIDMFLCKKKSPIVSIAVFSFLLLFMIRGKQRVKYYLEALSAILLIFILIETIPSLESIKNVVETSLQFWNDNLNEKTDVGGSNWELRVRQLTYPFVEIANNPMFGHGYGWCGWYLGKYELHPILFGFETIFATAVCECGIMGYIIYFFLFEKCYKYSSMYKMEGINFALLNVVTELVLIAATGLNYFYFFGFSIVLLNRIGKLKSQNVQNINCNSHLQLR